MHECVKIVQLYMSISVQVFFCLNLGLIFFYIYTGPAKDLYNDDRRIWNAMFEIIVADLAVCQRDGIDCGGNIGRIYPIVLANKGDWSYLAPWCIKPFLLKDCFGAWGFQPQH